MTLLSIFGGGLFIIPLLTLGGAIWFGYVAYKAHNSNSTKSDREKGIIDNTGNVPYWQIGQAWFSAILFLATIVIVAAMISDK